MHKIAESFLLKRLNSYNPCYNLPGMAENLTIRLMTEADIPAGADILEKAFNGSGDRLSELQRYRRIQLEGWFLALCNGDPAGMVLVMDYGPFAHIGMMGVYPQFQRRGIARALMLTLLEWLDQRGCPLSVLDASAKGKPLYDQLGFEAHDRTIAYRLQDRQPLPGAEIPVDPVREEDIPALVSFDAALFGANRRAVLETFWKDYPGRSFLTRDQNGQISGYLIVQRQKIGPWAANRPEDARDLLAAALQLPFEDTPTVLAPEGNPDAIRLLEQAGFVLQRALPHMTRPKAPLPGRRDLLYAETSFAIG